MKSLDRKKIIIYLRWTVIIVTSYLILFERTSASGFAWGHLLIVIYILSNVVLYFLPREWFSAARLFYSLVVLDTAIVSSGMYLSERIATDFYLVFFLILIFASISRDYKLLVVISGVTSLVYGVLLNSWGLLNSEEYTLRIPFLFIMAAFYGYIVQSFSQEKQKQAAIYENKYQGLFQNANDGILLLKGSSFRIDTFNRKMEQLTGYNQSELVGMELSDLFGFTEKEEITRFVSEVSEKGMGSTDALSVVRKDGTTCEVDVSTNKINLGEEILFQAIIRDLTDERRLQRKIRESKRSLQTIVDGIPDQLSLQKPNYEIVRVNQEVVARYQKTFQELIGRKCHEVYYGRSEPCEECPVAATFETRQPASIVRRIPEGERVLRISSYPISDETGTLISVLEYTKDITEEQRFQEQLIRSEKLAGLGILTSGFAHEINNPLSGIIGMAEIAMEEEDPVKVRECLNDILRCGQKIEEIVKELSSYSRTARREGQTGVDVIEVMENALKMVQRVSKTPVKVSRDFQTVERVEANSGELQLVFHHLLSNAYQAMNEKGGKLSLTTRPAKDKIEITVADNGMGIPSGAIQQIFDPFFTLRKVGEGKGLGLNIAYRIITKYDGTISAESIEHVGTTFTIQLPTWRGHEQQENPGSGRRGSDSKSIATNLG